MTLNLICEKSYCRFCRLNEIRAPDFNPDSRNEIVEIAALSFRSVRKNRDGGEFLEYISIWNAGQPEI